MSVMRSVLMGFLIFLIFNNVCDSSARGDNSNSKSGTKKEKSSDGNKQNQKKSGFHLSAFGLIMILLSFILSGIFIYYFFLFYPILCRKERNYDVVEHSRDTTPTPSTEKTP